jgi:hypothetical protein
MADYININGNNIPIRASDPSNPIVGEVWYNLGTNSLKGQVFQTAAIFSSGGSLPVPRNFGAGGGASQNAAWIAGGGDGAGSNSNNTFLYDGTSWSPSGNMGTTRSRISYGNSGPQTAGIAVGGFIPPSSIVANVEEFNGSTWTGGTNLPSGNQFHGGVGPQTANIILGGGSGLPSTGTLEYDGSTWTSGGSTSAGFAYYGLAGEQTSCLAFYGATSPAGTPRGTGEEYDGTSWTTVVPSLPNQRTSGQAQGTVTNALFMGNGTTVTHWDGTSLTGQPAMSQPRGNGYIGGTATSGVTSGGSAPGPVTAVEEFSGVGASTVTFSSS